MTTFHTPTDYRTPLFDFDKDIQVTAKTLTQMHIQHTEDVFREAVLRKCGGVMPDEMTLRNMGHIFIAPDGTKTLTWGGAENVIASVAPPRIYTP